MLPPPTTWSPADEPPHASGPASWSEAVPGRPHVPRLEDIVIEDARPSGPDPEPEPFAANGGVVGDGPMANRRRIAAALAAVALAGGLIGVLVTRAVTDEAPADRLRASPSSSPTLPPSFGSRRSPPFSLPRGGFGPSAADVVAGIAPSVVGIRVDAGDGGGPRQGTGLVVSSTGDVVTNAHLLQGAGTVEVIVPGQAAPRAAAVVGTDPATDLALVRITGTSALDTASLAGSGPVSAGDDVVVIGNALGLPTGPTVTKGIVSALGRSASIGSSTVEGLIQTDADIGPGNTGGPVVDVDGDVVGIATSAATAASGTTGGTGGTGGTGASAEHFAVPVDVVRAVLDRLRGPAARLGVTGADAADGSPGASVVAVAPGSPADEAGLRLGDRVVRLDGVDVTDAPSLAAAVRAHRAGDVVELVVVRGGRELTFKATLGSG
jgi:putative serine protease PepD